MCFHAPSRPRKMDKFLFFSYRNTYKIRHYKKDNGNPTINYFIYEFHSNRNTCPTETEFVTCYPLAEQAKIYLRGKDDSFESTWESNYIALHCRNPCCIFERGWPPCFSHVTIPFPRSPLSSRSTEKKWRTGANSSSRKKGLTEPGSLTNTKTNTNIIEKSCLFCILSPVPLLPRALRNRSDHIDIPSTQHRSSKGSRRPTKARKPGSFRKWIPIRRVHNRMDKLTLTRQFGIQFGIFLGRYREGIGME